MSKAPSMPMYWDAYLADTTHLTLEEHGAYLLLLGAMWRRNGCVPDDDKDNARILGMTTMKWRKIKNRLSSLLILENDTISQKNLQKIWRKTQEKIQKNIENGRKGGRPISNKNNILAKANGYVSLNPNHNPNVTIPEPEPEPYIKKERKEDILRTKKIENKFEEFWKIYPRRFGGNPKKIALNKFIIACRKTDPDRIIAGAEKYAQQEKDRLERKFIAQAVTWLNQERWNDDYLTSQKSELSENLSDWQDEKGNLL